LSNAFQDSLDPAPITPFGADAAPYQHLSGTIKATYNTHRSINDADSVIVAPSMMSGNTDTRFYWKLSPHIFRYNHHNAAGKDYVSGLHTVVYECTLMFCVKSTFCFNADIFDIAVTSVDAFIEKIRFFGTLILNADEAEL
jgi:Gly-Xaa carboxypeptidase